MIPFLKLLDEVVEGLKKTPSEELKQRFEETPKVPSYDFFLKNVDPAGSLTDYNDWLRDQ